MTDISKYAEKILAEEDGPLFQEAVVSAHHGASRGAYILIWIACAEGFKRKFREASARDGKANKIISQIAEMEGKQRSVDAFILEKAKEYGFIDDVAFQKLEYVYKMRCVYGHPYEAAPDDEELTNAAAVVVNEVLGRPTLFKEGFVQTLINNLFTDINYLEQSETSARSFTRDISNRIAPAIYNYVLETYAKKLEGSYDDVSLGVVVERGLWFLSEFLISVGCDFYSATQWHDFAAEYPKTAQHIILSNMTLSEAVGERARDYIVSYNIENVDARPSRLKEVEKLLEAGLLSDGQKRRLQSLDIRFLKAANLKISTCYSVIIPELKSHNWYRQKPAIDLIAASGKSEIAALPPEKQEELGRNILQVAEGASVAALAYLSLIREDPSDLERPFLKGLIFEAFVNEKLEFRFKGRCIAAILDLLTNQKGIEAELVTAIDASKPRTWIDEATYQGTLDLVKKRPSLQLLAEALERNSKKLTSIRGFEDDTDTKDFEFDTTSPF